MRLKIVAPNLYDYLAAICQLVCHLFRKLHLHTRKWLNTTIRMLQKTCNSPLLLLYCRYENKVGLIPVSLTVKATYVAYPKENFPDDVPRDRDHNAYVYNFWKVRPQNFHKKRPNFGPIFDNFQLSSRISPELIDISNIWEKLDQPQRTPSTLGEKNFGELWSTNKKVLLAHSDQPT